MKASRSHIENLEARRLLTAITVTGSSGADEIHVSVSSSGSTILVDVNGIGQSYPDFLYDGVSITASGGNDRIYVDSDGDNRVTVNGGSGADETHLANATGNLSDIASSVTFASITAGDGVLLHDDSNAAADTYAVDGGTVTRPGFVGVTISGLAYAKLYSGDGADTFNIVNTPVGTQFFLDGQAGMDLLNLNANGGGAATVTLETNQDFANVQSAPGGDLVLTGGAGLLLNTNLSNFEGNVTLDRGYIVERNSQAAGGLGYWRQRLIDAKTSATPYLASSFATASTIGDGIGFGYAQSIAPTMIGGYTLATGDLVLRYTLLGDTDLDLDVDFSDLLAVAQNYGATSGKDWTQGDFNQSRSVAFDDLLALAQNYAQNAPTVVGKKSTPAARRNAIDELA